MTFGYLYYNALFSVALLSIDIWNTFPRTYMTYNAMYGMLPSGILAVSVGVECA